MPWPPRTSTANVVGDPALEPVLRDLRARMDRWMRETRDPLLKGSVPLPQGAIINDPDGMSPREPVVRLA